MRLWLQEVHSTVCSILFRSKMKRATSFCFWLRIRISPTRRTFSCVSCTIVVSSSPSFAAEPSLTKRFSLECISIDVTDELHSKVSEHGPYIGYGLNVPNVHTFSTYLTFRASYTAITLHAARKYLMQRLLWEQRHQRAQIRSFQ